MRLCGSACSAVSRACLAAGSALPAGHARPAEVQAAARVDVLRRRPLGAAAGRRAPSRAGSCDDDALLYTGQGRTAPTATVFPFPVDATRAWRAARSATTSTARRATAAPGSGDGMIVRRGYRRPPSLHDDRLRDGAGRPLLRRDHERLRRDAGLRRADHGRGPLGDRRLHPRAAAERSTRRSPTCRPAERASSIAADDAADAKPPTSPIPELAATAAPAARRRRRRRCWCRSSGCSSNPAQFFQSYLMAYMFCLGVTLGCLALGMIHQLTGGAWGVVIRRPIGAATRVLPVHDAAVPADRARHASPLRLDARRRRRARRDAAAQAALPEHAVLPGPRGDLLRSSGTRISYFLNAWSLEQDRTGDPRLARRMQMLSGGGLRRLRPDDHVRVVRLADVARAALVLDDLRRADHRRPGPDGAGVPDRRARVAQPPAAARPHRRARRTSTTSAT